MAVEREGDTYIYIHIDKERQRERAREPSGACRHGEEREESWEKHKSMTHLLSKLKASKSRIITFQCFSNVVEIAEAGP